jgi:hypothetical protein
MTHPTGRSFLSYKRERKAEAELLIAALHDVGIPTWRDLDDLDELPTEDEIRRILRDPGTANAILWLTPEVAKSEMIRKVEAPLILERARQDDDFFVIPVAAGGLDYGDAATLLDSSFTLEDLKHWNLRKVAADPIGPAEAAEIAMRVLRRRVAAIHASLPAGAPLKLVLHTRKAPASLTGALSLHWLHRCEESGFQVRCESRNLGGRDLAVLISVTNHVEPAFRPSLSALPPFRALLRIWKDGDPPHDLENAEQAAELAYSIQREIRKALKEYPAILCVHLFMAVPLGLAMMIGQLLNNVNSVQTYELVSGDAGKSYKPAALLDPSG